MMASKSGKQKHYFCLPDFDCTLKARLGFGQLPLMSQCEQHSIDCHHYRP